MEVEEYVPDVATRSQLSSILEIRPSEYKFRKRIRYKGTMYAVEEYHTGNAIILFFPSGARGAGELCAGVIRHIITHEDTTKFVVQRYLDLPEGEVDPFSPYKDFPARMYSSKLAPMEAIDPDRVKCHASRFIETKSSNAVITSLSRY